MSPDDRGWISLHRKIIDSKVFADPYNLKVWVWCLTKANHKTRYVEMRTGKGSTTLTIRRGQFLFGRNTAAEILSMSPSTVRRRMKFLETEGMISLNVDNQYSLVTICNYEDYQNEKNKSGQPLDNQRTTNGQRTDSERTTNGQPTDTNNNENNADNENNENKTPPEQNSKLTKPLEANFSDAGCSVQGGIDFLCVEDLPVSDAAIPESLEEVMVYCREHGIKRSVGKTFYGYFKKRGWKMKTGQPVTKWQAKFKGWLKHEKNEWRAGVEEPEPKQRARTSMQAIDLTPVEMTAEEFRAQLKREA